MNTHTTHYSPPSVCLRRSACTVFIAGNSGGPLGVQRSSSRASSEASVSSSVNVTSPNGGFDFLFPPRFPHRQFRLRTLARFYPSPPSKTSANLHSRSARSKTSRRFHGSRYTRSSNTRSESTTSNWYAACLRVPSGTSNNILSRSRRLQSSFRSFRSRRYGGSTNNKCYSTTSNWSGASHRRGSEPSANDSSTSLASESSRSFLFPTYTDYHKDLSQSRWSGQYNRFRTADYTYYFNGGSASR